MQHVMYTVGRRQWILDDCPSVHDVLDKFPSLKKTKYVTLHHYTCALCNNINPLLLLLVSSCENYRRLQRYQTGAMQRKS